MNWTYDQDADILLIRLRKGKLDHGKQKNNVITHFSKNGKLLEVEILDALK